MTDMSVLSGLRVLEISSFLAAPACAMLLGELGAQVTKIEPFEGDPYRLRDRAPGNPRAADNYCWMMTGRHKESLALDLKHPSAREVVMRLVRESDVFITNMSARARSALGIAYDALHACNRRLVYASLSAYGERGPDADNPGFDSTAWWARSGIMGALQADPAHPPITNLPGMGDSTTGMSLFAAVLAALYRRERTGEGGHVGTSLLANGLWSNQVFAQAALCGGSFAPRRGREQALNALHNSYACADGRWLVLAVLDEARQWPALLAVLNDTAVAADERFATRAARHTHAAALVDALDRCFRARTWAQWRPLLAAAAVPAEPVVRMEDLASDPQLAAAGMVVPLEGGAKVIASPIQVDGAPAAPARRAPEIGQDTRSVLERLGFPDRDIEGLLARGVARQHEAAGELSGRTEGADTQKETR